MHNVRNGDENMEQCCSERKTIRFRGTVEPETDGPFNDKRVENVELPPRYASQFTEMRVPEETQGTTPRASSSSARRDVRKKREKKTHIMYRDTTPRLI